MDKPNAHGMFERDWVSNGISVHERGTNIYIPKQNIQDNQKKESNEIIEKSFFNLASFLKGKAQEKKKTKQNTKSFSIFVNRDIEKFLDINNGMISNSSTKVLEKCLFGRKQKSCYQPKQRIKKHHSEFFPTSPPLPRNSSLKRQTKTKKFHLESKPRRPSYSFTFPPLLKLFESYSLLQYSPSLLSRIQLL